MTPSESGWTENVLYNFQERKATELPLAGLIFDPSGNLYGATTNGGSGGGGTVFELTPSQWQLDVFPGLQLYRRQRHCRAGCGSLVMDGAGNLYGTTYCDGANTAGNVLELTHSGNSWTYTSLHDFTGGNDGAISEQ